MKKKVIDIIGMVIIGAIITTLNLIVGANEKGLRIFPLCIMLVFTLFYLIIRKIMLKEKMVIKNKVDLFVLVFMCCTLLPLIFGTYSTYQGTIEFILKYFFAYSIYLLVRNVVDTKTKINILILVTLTSSLIIAIIGIDVQHKQSLNWLLDELDLRYTYSEKLVSSFGYANTVAVYFSFFIFLAIHQIQNSEKVIVKILCSIYLVLGFYIVSKTLSRAVFALLLGAIGLYFVLYYFPKMMKYKKQFRIVIAGGFLAGVALLVFVFAIGVKVSKPYQFAYSSYQRNFNYNFKPNETYTMELELEIEGSIEVQILEINTYFHEKVLVSKSVEPKDKKIALTFTTTDSLYQIDMLITNQDSQNVSLKKCYINEKEYPLNYKYLPYQIGKAVTMYSANDKSVKQRTDFWKDCIKMAKDSPLIGQGGDTWKKVSQAVQDYPYGMKETHSYFFELLISYGIVGVGVYLVLLVYFHINVIKDCIQNKENRYHKLPILFGLDLIILHSLCFDFDMSFLCVFTTVFAYMAVLMYDTKEEIQNHEKVDYVVFTFLGIILIIFMMANIAQDYIIDKKMKKNIGFYMAYWKHDYINQCIANHNDFRENLREIQNLMKKEPYFWQTDEYDKYWGELLENLDQLSEDELIEYLAFVNKRYQKARFVTTMYIDTILPRVRTMQNAYIKLKNKDYTNERLKEQIENLNQIIQEEYEVNKRNIEDSERNGCDQGFIDNIMKEYNKILSE